KVLSDNMNRVVVDNEADLRPTIANMRQATERLTNTLDPATQANLKAGINQFSAAATRLDTVLADLGPLAKDLGGDTGRAPTTNMGQTLLRVHRFAYDFGLLTRH